MKTLSALMLVVIVIMVIGLVFVNTIYPSNLPEKATKFDCEIARDYFFMPSAGNSEYWIPIYDGEAQWSPQDSRIQFEYLKHKTLEIQRGEYGKRESGFVRVCNEQDKCGWVVEKYGCRIIVKSKP